jgi:hypothetical protein
LSFSATPDEIIVHTVRRCQAVQQAQPPAIECWQVVEVPRPRVLVREHQAEQKQCPVQYASSRAIAVSLVHQQLWRTCRESNSPQGVPLLSVLPFFLPLRLPEESPRLLLSGSLTLVLLAMERW